MSIPNRRGPRPLSEILGELFTLRGYGRLRARQELEEAWNTAVGEPSCRQTRLGEVRRGVLNVTVAHSTLLEELMAFRKSALLAALRSGAPATTIHDIRFRVGEIGVDSNAQYWGFGSTVGVRGHRSESQATVSTPRPRGQARARAWLRSCPRAAMTVHNGEPVGRNGGAIRKRLAGISSYRISPDNAESSRWSTVVRTGLTCGQVILGRIITLLCLSRHPAGNAE